MTAITPQEYMTSLKEKYNLSATETLFDLPENLQLKFQVEFQKLIHPEQNTLLQSLSQLMQME